jgi:hypothetical protein
MYIRAVMGLGSTLTPITDAGLLPYSVESLDRQMEPGIENIDAKPNDLERYNYLIAESDRNETTIAIHGPLSFAGLVNA